MVTFLSILLFVVCVILILMVLIQDPKGGGAMGGMLGGGGSNTLWGASGAATFIEKVTRITAILFFVVTFALAWQVGKRNKSVTEEMPIPAASGADSIAPTETKDAPVKDAATSAPPENPASAPAAPPATAPTAPSANPSENAK